MEQSDNNYDYDDFNILFSDGDYSTVLNDTHFSNGIELEDNNSNEFVPPLLPNDASDDYALTADHNDLLELIRLMPDTQQDINAILDEELPTENSVAHQNPTVINDPTPQQASGSQNGIMYQMYPSLFYFIAGVMSVIQQPKANNRSRYQCDGLRFLPDSRHHPMSITLPDLQSIILDNNQTLGIVLTIVTNTTNETNVHANDIIYRQPGAEKIAHGCAFVPLTLLDIQNGEKTFPRLSIIYKKCDEYTFDLTPFSALTMFGATEKYIGKDKNKTGNAAKGKSFKEDFNLLSYKIIFQLALKQDKVVYISNITCETEPVDEQKITRSSRKRSASVSTEAFSEEEEESSSDVQISRPSKKFKPSTSTPPLVGLPVTRVSNLNMDSQNDPCLMASFATASPALFD